MRRFQHPLRTGISALLLCGWIFWAGVTAQADSTGAPSLGISQFKVTSGSGQFITLYNLTAAEQDLSSYQLEYFNHYDVSKATSSKLIALSGFLPPHSYYVINDSTMVMCYRATVESVSLGLSSTAGLVELLSFNQTSPGGMLRATVQDYVAWSKTPAAGAQTLPGSSNGLLFRQPLDYGNSSQINAPGAGAWLSVQPDVNNPCSLVSASNQSIPTLSGQLLTAQEPAATIANVASAGVPPPAGIPDTDNGLMSPKITELLPNPNGTGNDATDEFIELYNANSNPFDLSGFKLQTGTTTTHNYTFPQGTTLKANSFTVYYSSQTRLGLSNSGGQAALIDPPGNVIGQSDPYSSAGDGQAWALANGKWYWTTEPTPGAANIIKQILGPNSKAKSSPTSKAVNKGAVKKLANTASTSPESGGATAVQSWLLALIGVIALIYGAYEYRQDLANRIHQLRSHFGAGRTNRPPPKGRRGN